MRLVAWWRQRRDKTSIGRLLLCVRDAIDAIVARGVVDTSTTPGWTTWARPESRPSPVHVDAAYRPIPRPSGVVAAPAGTGQGTSVHSERVG